MFKLVVILVIVAVIFTGLSYYNMAKRADRFMIRIEREVLALFDRRDGLDSVKQSVMRVAGEEKIKLEADDLEVRIVPISSLGSALAAPDNSTEAIEVAATFPLEQSIFSGKYTRRVIKYLSAASGGSQSYSSGGFPMDVNMSHPTRDVQSYRDSVGRAVAGQNP